MEPYILQVVVFHHLLASNLWSIMRMGSPISFTYYTVLKISLREISNKKESREVVKKSVY
jgi:hypothetical protein